MTTSPRSRRLADTLALLERRRRLLRTVVVAVVLVGLALTALAPGVLPSTPLVGALVGLAAIVLGLLAAVAADAGDDRIRGPRHVTAIGDLVAVLPTAPGPVATGGLAAAILEARTSHRLVLGLTGTGRGVDVAAWADALGVALAERDASVLVVDVASGPTPQAGLLEVVRDGASLGRTVSFERDIKLARLGAGRDLDGALQAAAVLPTRLPKDLEVLLVALPPLADGDVLAVAGALDTVFILARSDATPKVRLQGGIEALDKVGTLPQVVLLDDRAADPRAPRPAPRPRRDDPAAAAEPSAPEDRDPAGPGAPEVPARPRPERPREVADEHVAGGVADHASDAPVAPALEDLAVEEPAADDPAVEDPAPADLAPADLAPARLLPTEGRTPADLAPDDPTPDDLAPRDGAADDLTPRDVPPRDAAEDGEAPDAGDPDATASLAAVDDAPASAPQVDPWEGPPRATPRAELERRPSPSVRLVRDLPTPPDPPTPASEVDDAAEAAPPAPAPTVAARPRDPEVVAGAAAARLAEQLRVGTPPDEVTTDRIRREPSATPSDTGAADTDGTAADGAGAGERAAVGGAPQGDAPTEDDPTDEIPAVRDELLSTPEPEDDPLRTTARLAILMDELHEREDGPS